MNAIMRLHRAMAGYLAAQGGGGGSKYIEFADQAVLDVLMANGVSSDGVGITTADVEKVTSIGTWFQGNTEITSFDEFEKFTGVTTLEGNIQWGAVFDGCTNLQSIKFPAITTISDRVFNGCSSLAIDVDVPTLTSIGQDSFRNSGIISVSNLGSVTNLSTYGSTQWGQGLFYGCANLRFCRIPQTVTSIPAATFYGCSSLTNVICEATSPPTLGATNAFSATPIASGTGYIYVPDASVDAYKAATNWAQYRGVIKAKVRIETKIASETSDQLTMYHITDELDATWEITSGNDIASISSSGLITFSSYGTVTVVGRSGEHEASIEIVHKATTTLFSIDETMTTTPHDTGLCLFSDAMPKWTIAVNATADLANTSSAYASLLSCEHPDPPYRGLNYIRDGASQNMSLAFSGGSGTVYTGQLIPVVIRRNENLIEYSTDGASYTTVIPDVSSLVDASPSLAETPLWVGNNCNGLSRQFAGRVKCVIYDDVVNSPLLELD